MNNKYVLEHNATEKWLHIDSEFINYVDSFLDADKFDSEAEAINILKAYKLSNKDFSLFQLKTMAEFKKNLK
ncbi:MAG: hypothetical protein ACOC22_01185 [bacterium]